MRNRRSGLRRRALEAVIIGEPDGDALFPSGFRRFFHPDDDALNSQPDALPFGRFLGEGDDYLEAGSDDGAGLEIQIRAC